MLWHAMLCYVEGESGNFSAFSAGQNDLFLNITLPVSNIGVAGTVTRQTFASTGTVLFLYPDGGDSAAFNGFDTLFAGSGGGSAAEADYRVVVLPIIYTNLEN